MLTYFLFLIGFVFLIKGADLLVEGAASIAKRYQISDIIIGLTIVSFGTSAPELFVNVLASYNEKSDLAFGNIIGSNIANILLILGVAAIIYPIKVQKNTIWKEIPFSIFSLILLGFFVFESLVSGAETALLSRWEGIILILFFILFLIYAFRRSKALDSESDELKAMSLGKSVSYILVGLVGLTLGGSWIVDGAIKIAYNFGLSESVIGLTIVAIGTSLPELAASAMAAYKRNSDIAMGNAVGSNIFNILWVLGFSALVKPLSYSALNNFDIWMCLGTSLVLFFILFFKQKFFLGMWKGICFLLLYMIYLYLLVHR